MVKYVTDMLSLINNFKVNICGNHHSGQKIKKNQNIARTPEALCMCLSNHHPLSSQELPDFGITFSMHFFFLYYLRMQFSKNIVDL